MIKWFSSIPFMLRKDYMDCIDEQGNCFIVYWANLKLFFFNFIYSALIFSDENDHTIEKSSLHKVKRPDDLGKLIFENRKLGVSGYWEKCDNELKGLLYRKSKNRNVEWHCHHPKSMSEICFDQKTYTGLGYAETLGLSVKPWLLPVQELKWGRYLSEKDTVIWINWRGEYPINWLSYNGVKYTDAVFETNRIVFNNNTCQLCFPQISVVKEGKLTKLFAKNPWMKILFPARILQTKEVKYKARTSFLINNCLNSQGWSLFEIVSWKN